MVNLALIIISEPPGSIGDILYFSGKTTFHASTLKLITQKFFSSWRKSGFVVFNYFNRRWKNLCRVPFKKVMKGLQQHNAPSSTVADVYLK